ncbi:unnamed protein product [Owenia fusiformis]|uniref:Uncharacterized protein n=1 Tax=Owenia fusiformis TaxID=6347 RepID=A0A8J1U3B6_OWEFU|nr:unnamed protein product [Owenia fusiformis]
MVITMMKNTREMVLLFITVHLCILITKAESLCRLEKIKKIKKEQLICEYHLDVTEIFTMTYNETRVIPDCTDINGKSLEKCVACPVNSDCGGTDEAISFDHVTSADGIYRKVIAINGQSPGPKLEAIEGAHVVVHVTNNMLTESISVHWHGVHMKDNFYMDGVPYVSQCPIDPGQTFTYRFFAQQAGTYIYHSHTAAQASDGLAGAFIIHRTLDPLGNTYDYIRVDNVLTKPPPNDFMMVIQDWRHKDAEELLLYEHSGGFYPDNPFFPNGTKKFLRGKSSDGTFNTNIPYTSGLINGRMRYKGKYVPHTRIPIDDVSNQVPYAEFKVKAGSKSRFRMIGAQFQFPYMISIDGHQLTVIATDGHDINPIVVDNIVIFSGERYDFVVHANQNSIASEFWIRGTAMEYDKPEFEYMDPNQEILAILRYENSRDYIPTTSRGSYTLQGNAVRILNCPVNYFPTTLDGDGKPHECIKVSDVKRFKTNSMTGHGVPKSEDSKQYFFNFANNGDESEPAVNGKHFLGPSGFYGSEIPSHEITPCPDRCSAENVIADGCHCTHAVLLKHNGVYQFVLLNMGTEGGGRIVQGVRFGITHPIHMHGHHFNVLKMVYPELDEYGIYKRASDDICCPCPDDETKCCTNLDDSNRMHTSSTGGLVFCKNPRWRNATWGENIPGLNHVDPPLKDTVIVPPGGYTVIEFKAENPGRWLIHCHTTEHLVHGMTVLLLEAAELIPKPPPGLPRCSSFNYTKDDYFKRFRKNGNHQNTEVLKQMPLERAQ